MVQSLYFWFCVIPLPLPPPPPSESIKVSQLNCYSSRFALNNNSESNRKRFSLRERKRNYFFFFSSSFRSIVHQLDLYQRHHNTLQSFWNNIKSSRIKYDYFKICFKQFHRVSTTLWAAPTWSYVNSRVSRWLVTQQARLHWLSAGDARTAKWSTSIVLTPVSLLLLLLLLPLSLYYYVTHKFRLINSHCCSVVLCCVGLE